MVLQVFLRFVLGMLSRVAVFARPLGALGKIGSQSFPAVEMPRFLHEWIHMANVPIESSRAAPGPGRGAFERPTHPLGSICRFVGRLLGVPQLCPARVRRNSFVDNPHMHRR
jgi:hypothetical protein